jgi:hypothetical protein
VSDHDYTPERALEVLLRKLGERDARLEGVVRAAIDAGQDIVVTEPRRNGRGKPRIYRQTVPFTHEEALQVALDVLRAYFIELPLFINSTTENFRTAAVGIPRHQATSWRRDENEPEPVAMEAQGIPKDVEIELETATQISRTPRETMPLKPLERLQVDDQLANLTRLASVVNFVEDQPSGDSH